MLEKPRRKGYFPGNFVYVNTNFLLILRIHILSVDIKLFNNVYNTNFTEINVIFIIFQRFIQAVYKVLE